MPAPKRSAKTVSIACKLPQGLTVHLLAADGTAGPVVKLHGANSPFNIAGHGITQNVPVEHWEAIQKQHAHALWLKNEFVFANGDGDDLIEEANDKTKNRNGFEAIDPNNLPGVIQNDGEDDPGKA
jgi:hypothetical protein